MNDSTRRRRFRAVGALLFVLAITTGWVQSASTSDRAMALQHGSLSAAVVGVAIRNAVPSAAATSLDSSNRFPRRVSRIGPRVGPTISTAAPVAVVSAPRVKPPAAHSISGTNHFWFPALGMSRPVYFFQCTRKRAPDNLIYRWGCAGHNNVYLLGHAYGVMKPLHDAYVNHRLRVGMIAMYADGNGHIRSYRITEWRVVDAGNSNWAAESLSRPGMTLQTCVGSSGTLRLNVRLMAVG